MQKDLESSHPNLNIQLLVINEEGRESGNAGAASGRDLPLLQDMEDGDTESAWFSWDVTWRDVIVVDANSEIVATYNLTRNNLTNQDNYDELKEILVGATAPATLPGDCDSSGGVDASDLSCVSDIQQRDVVLDALNTLPGDLDGNGEVAFADFLLLSTNFGQNLPNYSDGNIDLKNGVDFSDFLVLSRNFGQTLQTNSAAASTDEVFGEWDTESGD